MGSNGDVWGHDEELSEVYVVACLTCTAASTRGPGQPATKRSFPSSPGSWREHEHSQRETKKTNRWSTLGTQTQTYQAADNKKRENT